MSEILAAKMPRPMGPVMDGCLNENLPGLFWGPAQWQFSQDLQNIKYQ